MIDNIQRRGLMFVLSSPSGAGKTTLTNALLALENDLTLSVSMTTRKARPGEVNGKDYIFVNEEEFNKHVASNMFLEYANVFGHWYGTPKTPVEEALGRGMDVIFDIDWQGAQALTHSSKGDVVKVFILPPSYDDLEKRLFSRQQDSEVIIRSRMEKACSEMSHWAEYDYVVINHDLDETILQLRSILLSERLKRHRRNGLVNFVRTLIPNE